jgi:hypothetical protein
LFVTETRPFHDIDLSPPGMPNAFEPYRNLVWRTAVSLTGRATIEPAQGWVISSPVALQENSIIDARFHRRPTIRRYLADRVRLPTLRVRRPVASLRTVGEGNYFHLLIEVLGGRARLLDEHVPPEVPVVLAKWLREHEPFRAAVSAGAFGGREIIYQGHEYLSADGVYFFETSRHDAASILRASALFTRDTSVGRRRLFVTRRSTRRLQNEAELVPVLRSFGFEVVDPSALTMAEQVDLFASASHVVGIHGAGLTNLIFRGHCPAAVLELHHPKPSRWGAPPADYFYLCRTLGYRYDGIIGHTPTADDWSSSFAIEPVELRAALERLVA